MNTNLKSDYCLSSFGMAVIHNIREIKHSYRSLELCTVGCFNFSLSCSLIYILSLIVQVHICLENMECLLLFPHLMILLFNHYTLYSTIQRTQGCICLPKVAFLKHVHHKKKSGTIMANKIEGRCVI